MKKSGIVMAASALVLLSACANRPQTTAAHGDPWVDRDRVAAVEREAKRAGVDVRWVNPPSREQRS